MTPAQYNFILRSLSQMKVIIAKTMKEHENLEKAEQYAGELRRIVQPLQQIPKSQFSPEGRESYYGLLSEIDELISRLAGGCDDSNNVMLSAGYMKGPIYILGEVAQGERPIIQGKSFWKKLKKHFKK